MTKPDLEYNALITSADHTAIPAVGKDEEAARKIKSRLKGLKDGASN